MKNMVKATGVALALGAAAMFTMAPVYASSGDATSTTVNCKGVNACKGQSACKTATNACKGQNDCKGKGVMAMTQDQCQKAGGTVDTSGTSGTGTSGTSQ